MLSDNLTTLTTCKTEIDIDIEKEIEKDIEQQLEQEKAGEAGKNIIFEKLKEAFGEMSVSGTMVTEAEDLLATHGQPLLLYALEQTILNNGRSIRYTRSILERWQGQGLKTIEQVKQNQAAYEAKKQPLAQPTQDNFPDVPF